jgi:hypothetical protein
MSVRKRISSCIHRRIRTPKPVQALPPSCLLNALMKGMVPHGQSIIETTARTRAGGPRIRSCKKSLMKWQTAAQPDFFSPNCCPAQPLATLNGE